MTPPLRAQTAGLWDAAVARQRRYPPAIRVEQAVQGCAQVGARNLLAQVTGGASVRAVHRRMVSVLPQFPLPTTILRRCNPCTDFDALHESARGTFSPSTAAQQM